jgi:prepilin-type N-terminal cleavage/methylation domain-containing protein
MLWARFKSSSRGFSLVEVLISMGILTVVSLGIAQLFAMSTKANRVARGQTSATTLAEEKMEQLRSLTWGFDMDGQGLPVSDTTTNLSVSPATADGGGLNPSPADSLETNRTGYFDYLGADGRWLGTGDQMPDAAVFIRRWSIQPLPTNPNNTLVLQVLVSPMVDELPRGVTAGGRRRLPGDALLTSVKTRKSS